MQDKDDATLSDARLIELEELIARVATGDRAAFDALYDLTSARLYALCLSLLKDRPEAEETLQEVFVGIWRGASGFGANRLSPMTWLITLARNRAVERLRERDRGAPVAPAGAALGFASLDASTAQPRDGQPFSARLAELDPAQADAIRAVYLEGRTYADLAGAGAQALRDGLRRDLLRLAEPAPGDVPLAAEDEALAAELALGLVDGDEAHAIVARLAEDAGFAQRVRDWQERLATMTEELTPVMPPARARQRIREELGHAQPPFSEVLDSRIRWWQRPLALLGAIAAVAVVALVLLMPVLRPGDGPGYQTQIVSQPAGLRVDFTLQERKISVALQSGAAPIGRDWEIWWMPADGSEPVSLGLVPHEEGTATRDLPQGLTMTDGVQIALSDEPEGGSPSGQATGPIMAISPLTRS